MSSGNESDDEPMSTDILKDTCDSNQSHPSINSREARYKIRICIKQGQAKWKGVLLYTQNIGKVLNRLFKAIVNEISQALSILVESGSKVSYFILEPRNFPEVTRLSEDIKKLFLKATLKEINKFNQQSDLFSSEART